MIRQDAAEISQQGRYAQGVTLIRLDEGDRVVNLARVVADESDARLVLRCLDHKKRAALHNFDPLTAFSLWLYC